MGLDMYLTKENYVKNWEHMKPEERHEVVVMKNGVVVDHVKPERISTIVEEVGQWRNANAIHKWFVDNVQGGKDECQKSYVERSQLIVLKNLCLKVLDNREQAHELLPAASGFLFGSVDYDEWYFNDLEYTVEVVEEIEKEENVHDYYYRSRW